jgi:hypothetical protein
MFCLTEAVLKSASCRHCEGDSPRNDEFGLSKQSHYFYNCIQAKRSLRLAPYIRL